MHDLGFNKIAAAILATALGFMLIKEASHMILHAESPEVPAYRIAIVDEAPEGPAEDLPFPQADWVAAMDAEKGAKVFKKCTSCHNADNGGKNGTGPNLWDIVGAAAAAKDGFAYSGAIKNSGVTWGFEELDAFLKKPKDYISGTKMSFVGIKKDADRAAVIEYLRQAAPTPVAQPAAMITEIAAPAEDDAPVTGTVEGGSIVDKTVDKAVETTGGAATAVKDGASEAVDVTKDVVKDVAEGAVDVAKDVKDGVEDAAGDVKDTAKKILKKAEDLVTDE